MKEKLKKIVNPTTIIILICGILFFIINTGLQSRDDLIYGQAFNNIPTCIKWISEFYQVWSGRITLTILINIFINLPIVIFKLANTAVFLITIFAIYKIISLLIDKWNKKNTNTLLILIFCSIFFISIPVLNSGCLWVAGCMNYLLPVSAMLVALIPFIAELKQKTIGRKYYVFAIIANFAAGFAEQTAAILIAFGLIAIIWCKIEKRKISKLLIAHYIIIVIFSLINLLAPRKFSKK